MSTGEGTISLRLATMDDLEMVFRWRNDPFILAHGSSHREVGWEEHQAWFCETLRAVERKMFIVVYSERPIGQVRFDRESNDDCVISVYLLREFTGQGWGVEAIRMGCASIFEIWDANRIIACVRRDNPRGRGAFLRAGFRETEATGLCPDEHSSLVMSRAAYDGHA